MQKSAKLSRIKAIDIAMGMFKAEFDEAHDWSQVLAKIIFVCFISHVQKQASDACHLVHDRLLSENQKVWYDKEANKCDVRGMYDGIAESSVFLLFATKDYFMRPYCIFELMIADKLDKPVIVVWETDISKGGFIGVGDFFAKVPQQFSARIKKHEAIPFRRRGYELDAFVKHLSGVLQKMHHANNVSNDSEPLVSVL